MSAFFQNITTKMIISCVQQIPINPFFILAHLPITENITLTF